MDTFGNRRRTVNPNQLMPLQVIPEPPRQFLKKGQGHGGAATTNDAKFVVNEEGYYEIKGFGNRQAANAVMT